MYGDVNMVRQGKGNIYAQKKRARERNYTTKMISIRVPKDLLSRMLSYRDKEGVAITFQMCKGAEMYLKEKEGTK